MGTLSSFNVGDMLKQWGQAFYQWLGITSGSFSDIPGNHIRVGHLFLERGETNEALRRAKLALWMRPTSAEAYALKAHAHAALGQKEEAQQAFNEAGRLGYAELEALRQMMNQVDKEQQEVAPDSPPPGSEADG